MMTIKLFENGQDTIIVTTENTDKYFRWKMSVNGNESEWSQYYQGILVHQGYMIVTSYWLPYLPEFVPIKLIESKFIKEDYESF